MGATPGQDGRQLDVTAALAALGLAGGDAPPRTLARAGGPLRVVPVGRRISLIEQPGAAELYVLAAAGLPGLLAMPVTMHRPAHPAEPDPRLRPEATNRLNTVYMVSFFVGGAAGSSLGSWAWQRWGWVGACTVGILFLVIGLLGFVTTSRRPRRSGFRA